MHKDNFYFCLVLRLLMNFTLHNIDEKIQTNCQLVLGQEICCVPKNKKAVSRAIATTETAFLLLEYMLL